MKFQLQCQNTVTIETIENQPGRFAAISHVPVPITFHHLVLLLATLLLSGCASTLCLESRRNLQPFQGGTQPVYVTNPELHREHEILRSSGIYQVSNLPDGARKLTLHPMQQFARCGNPLMLSALTLGIVPGFLPGAYVFEYELESNGVPTRYAHHLPLYERVSVWERLVKRDETQLFTEALKWSTLRQPSSPEQAAALPVVRPNRIR